MLGVWPSQGHAESEPWHVKSRVPFMIALIFFGVCVPQTWALVLIIDNLSLILDNLMTNVTAFGSCIKLFFLWRNKDAMRPVVESVKEDWLRAKSAWKRELMLKNAWGMRVVTIVDYSAIAVSGAGFIVFPVLHIEMRIINNITDFGYRRVLLQSYYPFDYSASPYFELIQIVQHLGTLFSALAITVPENYYGALAIHLSSQFDILSREIEDMFSGPIAAARSTRTASHIYRHVHLIAMIQALEYSFTYVTLAQILCTSVIVCSYGFQVLTIIGDGNGELPLIQMVALVVVMITMMLHTLVDCVVGETLAMQSTSLADSIYNCPWYAIEGKLARDLIPMMILSRTQKPVTAGKIFPLSHATFCSILKTTAGYISMLVTVNSK